MVASIENIHVEYKEVLLTLFYTYNEIPHEDYQKSARKFADALGIGNEYLKTYQAENSSDFFIDFLFHFQSNFDLLISKTWVEDSDEIRKEMLRREIPTFIKIFEKSDYNDAAKKFGEMLEDLAFLFFGKEIFEDSFIEYASRIDTQIGLFCLYSKQLKNIDVNKAKLDLRSLLLIGMCFINNF
ncbi:MAG: hypothetical protein Ta2G_15870 [Termitinemataceae bacterium]|nr:MAG: hypothetical protein Ta2G_15870 [Termitinemataceae bacterium]